MKVIWHLGAHRTATTSVQQMLDRDPAGLRRAGVVVWGPRQTRSGRMRGLMGPVTARGPLRDAVAAQSARTVRARISAHKADGARRLILSDENMLGGLDWCIAQGAIYPDAGARLARLAGLIGAPDVAYLTLRAWHDWWRSVVAFLIARGRPGPDPATLAAIVASRRGWADLVGDIRDALPRTTLHVQLHPRPRATVRALTQGRPKGQIPRIGQSLSPAELITMLRDRGHAVPDWLTPSCYDPFDAAARQKMLHLHKLDLDRLAASAQAREIVLRDGPAARNDRQAGGAPWPTEPSQPDMRTGRASRQGNCGGGPLTT